MDDTLLVSPRRPLATWPSPRLATSPSRTTSPSIVPSMHLGLPPRVELLLLGHRGKRRRLSPRVRRTTSPSRHVTVRCAAPRIQPRPAPGAGAGRMRGCASLTRPVWCTVTARVVLMRAGTSDGREVRVCDVLPCVSVCARCAVSWIARVSGIGCLFGSGVRIATSCSWMAVCTPHLSSETESAARRIVDRFASSSRVLVCFAVAWRAHV